MKLYISIIWVKSSGLFPDYRIFEDMHHGITINREFRNLKLYICTLGSSKVFVSDVLCMDFVLKCTILKELEQPKTI